MKQIRCALFRFIETGWNMNELIEEIETDEYQDDEIR